uniref:Uncharacterized protein n=1 Tax=Heliothis virescens TaxID=7102 RepID=A0A2A4IWV6_HELVI
MASRGRLLVKLVNSTEDKDMEEDSATTKPCETVMDSIILEINPDRLRLVHQVHRLPQVHLVKMTCLMFELLDRGRKAAVASVITLSPYKNDLIETNKKKIEKENKTKYKKPKQKKKSSGNKKAKTRDESESEEYIQFDSDSEPDAPIGRAAPDTAECAPKGR